MGVAVLISSHRLKSSRVPLRSRISIVLIYSLFRRSDSSLSLLDHLWLTPFSAAFGFVSLEFPWLAVRVRAHSAILKTLHLPPMIFLISFLCNNNYLLSGSGRAMPLFKGCSVFGLSVPTFTVYKHNLVEKPNQITMDLYYEKIVIFFMDKTRKLPLSSLKTRRDTYVLTRYLEIRDFERQICPCVHEYPACMHGDTTERLWRTEIVLGICLLPPFTVFLSLSVSELRLYTCCCVIF